MPDLIPVSRSRWEPDEGAPYYRLDEKEEPTDKPYEQEQPWPR